MMATSDPVMLQPRSSDTHRPRLPTLRHAGSFDRCSGSICFAWLLLAICILVESGESSTVPVLAMRQNCSSLIQAVAAFMRALGVQDMATQEWMEAVVSHPSAEVKIISVPVESPTGTSAPSTVGSESILITHPYSDDGWTPAAATPPSALPHTVPLDDAAVSFFQRLSGEKKAERLVQAAVEGAVSEIRALLAAGADVGARDRSEWTALHHAAEEGHVEAARCLLYAGAEVDARGWRDATPLALAARGGHTSVMWLLLTSSADPNARDYFGRTPLHIAALLGHIEAVAALLEAGADVGARDDEGWTPLGLARDRNHQQLVYMLERY